MSNRTIVSSIGVAARRVGELVLDLVFPRQCWSCSEPLARPSEDTSPEACEQFFCQTCIDAFPRIEPPYCNQCGEPYDLETDGTFQCWNCSGRRMGFEFAISAYHAEGAVREMIHRFKYGREVALRRPLASLLQEALKDERLASQDLTRWIVVPVPLHHSRQFERGFNQSWELCLELAKRVGATACEVLTRTRPTQSQASLDRRHRLRNLRGVFARKRSWPWCRQPDLTGACVLLVDDVLTTGATTHECARVLKRSAEVEKVVVITVARG